VSEEIITVDLDELKETWALRGHPVLIRRRWARHGVDLDSDVSVETFCETADAGGLVSLLVDLASMSEERELNRRADYPAVKLAAMDDSEFAP
jgi:hypothetical protein